MGFFTEQTDEARSYKALQDLLSPPSNRSSFDSVVLGIFGIVFIAILLICGFAIGGLLIAFPIKWCWNYVMAGVFGFPIITWWKSWCLSFVAGCLIKSSISETKYNNVFFGLLILVLSSILALLFAFPVEWCWNYAVVSMFDAPTLTWGQTWCLMFLSQIFLKSHHLVHAKES